MLTMSIFESPFFRYGRFLFLSGVLSACSWFSSDEDIDVPLPVPEFEQQIGLAIEWEQTVGVGTDDQWLHLAPAFSHDQVFVSDIKGKVIALQITGEKIWERDLETPLASGIGVNDSILLVGSEKGQLWALSVSTGETLWKVQLSSEILATPQIADQIILARSLDGKIFAFNLQGKRLWVYDRGVPTLTLRGNSTPVWQDNIAYIGFDSGKVVAVNIDNGVAKWEASVTVAKGRSEIERLVDIDGNIVLFDKMLYVATFQGNIAAINSWDGKIYWQKKMSSFNGLNVDNSAVYVTDSQSQVWALDRDTGKALWRQDKLLHRSVTVPVIWENNIVVADFEGYIYLLSRVDGSFKAKIRLDKEGILSSPQVYQDKLYVYGNSGELAVVIRE